MHSSDLLQLNTLVAQFFDLFTNTNGQTPQVENIKSLFIPQGIIIKQTDTTSEVYTLDSFITPRKQLLTDGTLTDFSEWEVSHETEIRDTIAHRLSVYQKSGILNGVAFEGKGVKSMQFVKTVGEWRFCSVVWCDE